MHELTFSALCFLAGYTVTQAETLGLNRTELILIIEPKQIAA